MEAEARTLRCRATRACAVTLCALLVGACQMTPERAQMLGCITGTFLSVAASNFGGQYLNTASTLVNLFAGSSPQQMNPGVPNAATGCRPAPPGGSLTYGGAQGYGGQPQQGYGGQPQAGGGDPNGEYADDAGGYGDTAGGYGGYGDTAGGYGDTAGGYGDTTGGLRRHGGWLRRYGRRLRRYGRWLRRYGRRLRRHGGRLRRYDGGYGDTAGGYGDTTGGYGDAYADSGGYDPDGGGGWAQTADAGVPPALDVALLQQQASGTPVPMVDGATLSRSAGDSFQIFASPTTPSYLYVYAVDATGWIQRLYPDEARGHVNPVSTGQSVQLPRAGFAFGLDEVTGNQEIWFLLSPRPRPDIEAQLAEFPLDRTRPDSQLASRSGAPAYDRMRVPSVLARGLVEVAAAPTTQLATASGQTFAVTPTRLFADTSADELAFSRWFQSTD